MLSSLLVFLVGDIGGTNTRLALADPRSRRVVRQQRFHSRDFASFYDVVKLFLADAPPLAGICIGAAGPVIDGRCSITNLPWRLDERELARRLKAPRARLVNDLVAIGWGAAHAPPSKLVRINGERPPDKRGKNLAIIAPGTGLGEAALIATGGAHVLLGTEGSHSDFAPRTATEWALHQKLEHHFGRVSAERAICGPALPLLYEFFGHLPETKAVTATLADAPDFNLAMVKLALTGKSRRAHAAVELFVSLLGAEAGNLVLRYLAVGGVFVAGSLAASVVPHFKRAFLTAFIDKGRYRAMLKATPVVLVNDSDIGLSGAALLASKE